MMLFLKAKNLLTKACDHVLKGDDSCVYVHVISTPTRYPERE